VSVTDGPSEQTSDVVVTQDDEIIAASSTDELLSTIFLVNSDNYLTESKGIAEAEFPDVLKALEETSFRLQGYPESDSEKLLLIVTSRAIEQIAYQAGVGTLRVGIQAFSRLTDEPGTYRVYEQLSKTDVKYHGRGGPWLRRGLWRGASETTGGEFNSARARPCGDSRGTSNTQTHWECHRNRGHLLQPWRVCPWASAPSRGRDTGPAHRVLSRSGCAGFARPITWIPNCNSASRYLKTGTQPSGRASPPPTVGRGTRAAFRLDVHIYGVKDTPLPTEFGFTTHVGTSQLYRHSWFLTFQPSSADDRSAGLFAVEREPNEWEGYWTFQQQRVDSINREITKATMR